ncbi:MAG: tetratricopeptide repeat protein [bacterium]
MKALITQLLLIIIFCFFVYMSFFALNRWRAERAYPIEKSFITKLKPRVPKDEREAERLEYSIDRTPGIYTYHILLGKYYAVKASSAQTRENRLHMLKRAEEEYQDALFLNPSYTEALSYIAWIDFSLKKPYNAIDRIETAIRLDPYNYFNHLYYGVCIAYFLNTLPQKYITMYIYRAEEELKRGLELNPSLAREPAVLMAKATLCLKKKDLQSAIGHLEKITQIDKTTIPYHITLASIYLQSNKLTKGERIYKNLLHSLHIDEKNVIIDSLLQAIKRYPDNNELKLVLGEAYFQKKEYDMTLATLKTVIKAAPHRAEAHYLMGQAYECVGDKNAALHAYEKTLHYSPTHPDVSKNILRLYREKILHN